MYDDFLKTVHDTGLVPMIAIEDAGDAVPLARALVKGGVPVAEVTFRTEAGEEAIKEMATRVPEIAVGAGTVTNVDRARRAVAAGASFIVTPGFNPNVVRWCIENGVPIIPGTSSPSDIEAAMELGLSAVKFFPAEASGGVGALKALGGPYADMRFLPTGGVGLANMVDYLSLPNVLAVGGSWLSPAGLVARKDFAGITEVCRRSVWKMHSFELAHVGINCDDDGEALATASKLAEMFGLAVEDKGGGYFAGDMADVVKCNLLGTKGHIGVNCVDVDRAIAFFERRGYSFTEVGAGADERGYTSKFFEGEVGGFAVHLRRR